MHELAKNIKILSINKMWMKVWEEANLKHIFSDNHTIVPNIGQHYNKTVNVTFKNKKKNFFLKKEKEKREIIGN